MLFMCVGFFSVMIIAGFYGMSSNAQPENKEETKKDTEEIE